ANREIKESQDSSDLLIDKREFQAVLRGVAREIDPDIHFQSAAIAILQEAAEGHTVALLRDSQVIADHNKRKTVLPRDIALARYL
ncbi:histone-fold-containing protein, partial [Chlamydoabsidia padenii]